MEQKTIIDSINMKKKEFNFFFQNKETPKQSEFDKQEKSFEKGYEEVALNKELFEQIIINLLIVQNARGFSQQDKQLWEQKRKYCEMFEQKKLQVQNYFGFQFCKINEKSAFFYQSQVKSIQQIQKLIKQEKLQNVLIIVEINQKFEKFFQKGSQQVNFPKFIQENQIRCALIQFKDLKFSCFDLNSIYCVEDFQLFSKEQKLKLQEFAGVKDEGFQKTEINDYFCQLLCAKKGDLFEVCYFTNDGKFQNLRIVE